MSLVTRFRDGLMSKALFSKISDLLAGPNVWPTKQTMPASTAGGGGGAGFRLPHGATPDAPVDGDLWSRTTGLFAQINGGSYQIATLSGTQTFTGKTLTQPVLVLKQSAAPAPILLGAAEFDTVNFALALGDGVGTQFMLPEPAGLVAGDLVYASGPKTKARRAIGAAGQVLTVVGGVPVWADRVTLSAAQVATGPAVDFIGIPAWVKMIVLNFKDVSLSGSDRMLVQLGDAGGFETAGYTSGAARGTVVTDTSGFITYTSGASEEHSGNMYLFRVGATTWVENYALYHSSGNTSYGGGNKTLSDVLTQLRITRSGSNNFDAGSITATLFG